MSLIGGMERTLWLEGEVVRLRHELSLAEEGLANYAQENQQLRALLTQAPIAKVIVREDGPADVVLYAPGLPLGEHDLYLMPEIPSSGHPRAD